ncbi:MAG: hypothetical protein AVDCRST_MAG89-3045, partial [uncultured Gemmatimonadetes bacterium]
VQGPTLQRQEPALGRGAGRPRARAAHEHGRGSGDEQPGGARPVAGGGRARQGGRFRFL